MKRGLEEDDEVEPESSDPKTAEDETTILQDLQKDLLKGANLNEAIEKRLFETQKQYFTVYMEKLMTKIPMGEDLIKIIQNRGNEFEYMFTAAKSVIQSQMRVKQIKAFHAVFDMVYSLMWRYVHERMVSPTLTKMLSVKQLDLAYERYQKCSNTEEEGSVVEMQCLLYTIQEMLESQEPVKIPNPLYSRFTQQMKAMSEYVIALLVALSRPDRDDATVDDASNRSGDDVAVDDASNRSGDVEFHQKGFRKWERVSSKRRRRGEENDKEPVEPDSVPSMAMDSESSETATADSDNVGEENG